MSIAVPYIVCADFYEFWRGARRVPRPVPAPHDRDRDRYHNRYVKIAHNVLHNVLHNASVRYHQYRDRWYRWWDRSMTTGTGTGTGAGTGTGTGPVDHRYRDRYAPVGRTGLQLQKSHRKS